MNNFEPDPKVDLLVADYLDRREKNFREATRLVRQNILAAQARMELLHNRRANTQPLKVGQEVLCFSPVVGKGQCRKFKWHWHGPFKVTEVSENGLNYTISRVIQGKTQTWRVHRERLWRRVDRGMTTLFGDPVREDHPHDVVPEAVYDPQDLLPTDNTVLQMAGGERDPARMGEESAEPAGQLTGGSEDINFIDDGHERAVPYEEYDLTKDWDTWTEAWESWFRDCQVTEMTDLAPETVFSYLHSSVHELVNAVLTEGPLPWGLFKSRMRYRIHQAQAQLITRIAEQWQHPGDSGIQKAWQDTEWTRKRTGDLLSDLAKDLRRDVRTSVILAEIHRRARDWVTESCDVTAASAGPAPETCELAVEAQPEVTTAGGGTGVII
jgi:hypothetical protein